MEICIFETREWTDNNWKDYISHFNHVFEKKFDKAYFEQKYYLGRNKFAYHSCLLNDGVIVGSCTVIPYEYSVNGRPVLVGLAVDVFIHEDFRKDPLALLRMYKKLKKRLKEEGVTMVIAVPNDTAYTYWKSLGRWKDIIDLPYYILPLNFSKLKNIFPAFINPIARFIIQQWLKISINLFGKQKQSTIYPIHLIKSSDFLSHRYYDYHNKISDKYSNSFVYRVVSENKVNVAYLIDFSNSEGVRDSKSLYTALNHFSKDKTIDMVIFVGELGFKQSLIFPLPNKLHPKPLHFTVDLIDSDAVDLSLDELIDYTNWDFGLINYDVR